MTLKELLDIANGGYGDSTLFLLYNGKTGKPLPLRQQIKKGDGLAMFVVNELAETYDGGTDEEVLELAIEMMRSGVRDLEDTIAALDRARREMPSKSEDQAG